MEFLSYCVNLGKEYGRSCFFITSTLPHTSGVSGACLGERVRFLLVLFGNDVFFYYLCNALHDIN